MELLVCAWVRRINTTKMAVQMKTNSVTAIPTKVLSLFLSVIEKNYLSIHMEAQKFQVVKAILSKRNTTGVSP